MPTRTVIGVTTFGGPEELAVHEVPLDTPGRSEVRIAVAAAAVNPTDTKFISGAYGDFDWDPPYVPGMDAAGTIDSVGEGVVGLSVGDRVMAAVAPARPAGGAYTDHLVVPASQVIEIPEGASLSEAATLPMNGITAKVALDALALEAGQTLAVTGAAGQLGSFAIPLAKARGLVVVADARPTDVDLVRSFGADTVVERGDRVGESIASTTDGGVDGLLDASIQGMAVVPGVRDGGRIAAVRAFEGHPGRGIDVHQVMVFDHLDDHDALEELRRLAGRGQISLRVADTWDPDRAADAHRRFAQGGVRGRFVLAF